MGRNQERQELDNAGIAELLAIEGDAAKPPFAESVSARGSPKKPDAAFPWVPIRMARRNCVL
jgi:hypothetical protein